MTFRTSPFLFVAAALACWIALPASAQLLPTTQPGPHAAQINGAPGKLTQDLYAVRIVEINGRSIQPRQTLWLEPGRYDLRVLVDIPRGTAFPRHPGETQRWRRADSETRRQALSIELEVEAGKTYQIRARYNRQDRRGVPFATVLWQIEE